MAYLIPRFYHHFASPDPTEGHNLAITQRPPPVTFCLSHFGFASRDKKRSTAVTSFAEVMRWHTLIFTKLIFWVQEITWRCIVTTISNTLGTYVFVQHTHTHTQNWLHQWCRRSQTPDSAASTACTQCRQWSSSTKPRYRGDTEGYIGTHDAPEVAQTFSRGHLRR